LNLPFHSKSFIHNILFLLILNQILSKLARQHTYFILHCNTWNLFVSFNNAKNFILQTAHEKYIRNKIVPSLYALSTDDVISDVALDDDNDNEPSNELTSSFSMSDKNRLV
jgi:hypothetical protein